MSGLTAQQKEQIENEVKALWNNRIYDHILTDEQRADADAMRNIAFEMEEILQKVAARFGLGGMGM